jgi:hypothetical protein
MPCLPAFYAWRARLATHLPHLTQPQLTVLALWSVGIVLARSCALTAVTILLATLLQAKTNTVRQRLREFTYEAAAKRGAHRRELDVSTCFQPLLAWVVSGWEGTHLPLALDATSLGDRFVVLSVSVLYRSCAIPVAWQIVAANQKGTWRPAWLRLVRLLGRAVPRHWTVIALADRGLYARWLFRRMVRLHWHPLVRINTGGTFLPAGERAYRPLTTFAPQPGRWWQGTGIAFQGRACRLHCTLLVWWGEGYKDPWLLLTDLPPTTGLAGWYGLRAWIEQGFKVLKRGGWQWQQTRMTDPGRAARLWLGLAVATLWLLEMGGEAETGPGLDPLPSAPRRRQVSIFRRGGVAILVALLTGRPLPGGRFRPEPWPSVPIPAHTTPASLRSPPTSKTYP